MQIVFAHFNFAVHTLELRCYFVYDICPTFNVVCVTMFLRVSRGFSQLVRNKSEIDEFRAVIATQDFS